MRWIPAVAVTLAGLSAFAADPVLEERAVNEKVSLRVPREFKVMSEEMKKSKYPSAGRPSWVYTNERGSVNVTANVVNQKVLPEQLSAVQKLVEATFKKKFPNAEWFRSELTAINGRQFVLVELRTPASDTLVRNIIIATSLEDKLLMISFNVTKELESEWLAVGNRVIESVRIK